MKLLGIEMSIEEFDNLLCEQSNGKKLVVENNKVIAKDRIESQQETNNAKLIELEYWFDNYFDKQLIQSQWQDDFTISYDNYFNKEYSNIEELKVQAKLVRNKIRELRSMNQVG